MSTLAIDVNPLAEDVQYHEDELIVSLVVGRKISVPLAWVPRLAKATAAERGNWGIDGRNFRGSELAKNASLDVH